MLRVLLPCALLGALMLLPTRPAPAQDDGVPFRLIEVSPRLSMLVGQGGNLAVHHGDDGVFLVDDQFAPLTDGILEQIRTLSDAPLRLVANTHWHGDHTGGNENLGKAGALIVAQRNVRERMSTDQVQPAFNRTVPASPEIALPKITFDESLDVHWNGAHVRLIAMPEAHTDGDALIHFVDDDAMHTGDLFVNGSYPFVDLASGGTFEGLLAAAHRVHEMCGVDTQLIPGHGELATPDDLRQFIEMLEGVKAELVPLLERGLTVEQVVRIDPLADLDAKWGQGFMSTDRFTGIAASSLKRSLRAAEER